MPHWPIYIRGLDICTPFTRVVQALRRGRKLGISPELLVSRGRFVAGSNFYLKWLSNWWEEAVDVDAQSDILSSFDPSKHLATATKQS